MKGGVPLKVPLKRAVALGRAVCDSGTVSKLGGSEHKMNKVKDVLTFGLGSYDQSC